MTLMTAIVTIMITNELKSNLQLTLMSVSKTDNRGQKNEQKESSICGRL